MTTGDVFRGIRADVSQLDGVRRDDLLVERRAVDEITDRTTPVEARKSTARVAQR
jgi:hypothetical protein